MSGGAPSQSQSGFTMPVVPKNLRNLTNASELDWLSALRAAESSGGLAALLQGNPEQIAQLTPDELRNIEQFQNIASGGSTGENDALSQLNALTSGPVGFSPETAAVMRAWQNQVEPTIQSSVASTGGGRGGAEIAALTQGETQAYMPAIEQEVQNRMQSVPLYEQLAQQRSADILNAMNASDLQRQIQQSGYGSAFQDFLRRSQLVQQFAQGPAQEFGPLTMGSRFAGTATSSGLGST